MPYSPATYEGKPYNRCIDCVHIGKDCDGPDFLAMSIERLCEWAKLRKSYLSISDKKWTNAYIAEQADVSRATVDRFLAGDIDDLKLTTASRIIKVLVNGTWGQYPCAMAAVGGDDTATSAECERLQDALDAERRKVDYLKEQVTFKENQMLAKDKILGERADFLRLKDKYIGILAVALAVCLVVIIGALVIDAMDPNMGFFWV